MRGVENRGGEDLDILCILLRIEDPSCPLLKDEGG